MLVGNKCEGWDTEADRLFKRMAAPEGDLERESAIKKIYRYHYASDISCVIFPSYNLLQAPLLRGLESGGRSTCVFAGPGLRVLSCAFSNQFAAMTASGSDYG